MPVKVRIIGAPSVRLVEYRDGMTVRDVLRELGLLSSEYVVARNGRVVAEDEPVEDGDEIVLYPVVSGG
ncbi:hypothetical protein Pyrde_1973 [Pyrodictium delaneyi]|uniref:Thiamine biosynthesis protein ThiS n=1 Tax=Pyrodictium delaneyi TaxID=1273541 RepID=A0A0P0N5F3_9CREN|nr:MoaD/ThiS family protein [Pyrodictium delaneyi]ALL02016.1 hypothetical protein Pyrde_1973 [Pyrodictium delaneyi]OWJ54820.1 thiamine biosynthesis protein ThiS [Pyrodictium delaneyi]